MTEAELFFYEHAGWSYNPETETPAQGRERGARALAAAELFARENGWYAETVHDDDVMDDDAGSRELVESGEAENLTVTLYSMGEYEDSGLFRKDHYMLGSLGGVVVPNSEDPHVRVVVAELALEAMNS